MNELELKRKELDEAKLRVKKIEDRTPRAPVLRRFEESTFFGWMSKNVTGEEINKLVKDVQSALIESNNNSLKIIREFKEVYNVVDVLDREYIGYFEDSINKLNKVNGEVQDAQKDIRRTIEALRATIEKHSKYENKSSKIIDELKSKIEILENTIDSNLQNLNTIQNIISYLEGFSHFSNIDETWEDVQKHTSLINEAKVKINEHQEGIKELSIFKNKIDSYKHIEEVDLIWEDVQKHSMLINESKERINEHQKDIEELSKFKNTIDGYKHIADVDVIWDELQTEKNKSIEANSEIEKINESIKTLSSHKDIVKSIVHLSDIDETWEKVQMHIEQIDEVNKKVDLIKKEKLESDSAFTNANKHLDNTFNDYKTSLDKKLMISYVISGVLFVFLILQFILTHQ
ncbi:hypothetical protein [Bergeyella sp. RCAD1439]|uniref:hypothetical protein n=1 Tax=Bergeyella anatis TaxID=3113737 RepID=UPI002E183EE2|nr:hypothetical protein [Bergeyella sp. RCAD1439]